MILVYHNIDIKSKDDSTVDVFHFFLHMFLVFKSKKQVVNLKHYSDTKNQIVITFDDGYKNIKKYALWILKSFNLPFELFIVDSFVKSGDNENSIFLSYKELEKMVGSGARLQYHSKSHKNLWEIDDDIKLQNEIICPDCLKELDKDGFDYFAYPCWRYNDKVCNIVEEHYKGARSGNGFSSNTPYTMDSIKIFNQTNLGEIINE